MDPKDLSSGTPFSLYGNEMIPHFMVPSFSSLFPSLGLLLLFSYFIGNNSTDDELYFVLTNECEFPGWIT